MWVVVWLGGLLFCLRVVLLSCLVGWFCWIDMLWPCDLVTVLLLSAECVVWFWFGPL